MPILKANEALPERPVIILLYGDPGIGKTSLFNTSNNPLLIDFDRGKDRAIFRKDTLVVNTWEDVEIEEKAGTFKNYNTVGIDTAKAALDDFLMSYVVKKDYKNAKNKLAAYGAIGDEFKIFVSNRRSENADIIIICHSKDDKDGETLRKIPDVTGGSYQLLLRIADQVGYMSMVGNKRSIQFEPTDRTVGKNVARLPLIEIPNETDPSAKEFMAKVIADVKSAICAQSEAQREALEKSEKFQIEIEKAAEISDLSLLLPSIAELPPYLQLPLIQVFTQKAISLIDSIKKVDDLNEALGLFLTAPLKITPVQAAIQAAKDRNKFEFIKETKQFKAPEPTAEELEQLKKEEEEKIAAATNETTENPSTEGEASSNAVVEEPAKAELFQ